LTSALDRGKWSASRADRFTPVKEPSKYNGEQNDTQELVSTRQRTVPKSCKLDASSSHDAIFVLRSKSFVLTLPLNAYQSMQLIIRYRKTLRCLPP